MSDYLIETGPSHHRTTHTHTQSQGVEEEGALQHLPQQVPLTGGETGGPRGQALNPMRGRGGPSSQSALEPCWLQLEG